MAKKNKKTPQVPSMEKYIKNLARKLPIGKCYINKDWEKEGMADILITREKKNGELVVGVYLVDTYCLGVKDSFCCHDSNPDEINEIIKTKEIAHPMEEISYVEVHNLIYGAIEFAEEAGIDPDKSFKLSQYVLDEDDDSIELIEYDYGKDGKHFLIVGPDGKEKKYLDTLKKNLGDNFHYIMPVWQEEDLNDEYDDQEEDEPDYEDYFSGNMNLDQEATHNLFQQMLSNSLKWEEEHSRHLTEEYFYNHPEYPKKLEIKHEIVKTILKDPANSDFLKKKDLKKLLSLPSEEMAEDLNNLIFYELGRYLPYMNNLEEIPFDSSALFHALVLIRELGEPTSIKGLLELLRQKDDLLYFILGDWGLEIIPKALAICSRGNLEEIEKMLYIPGFDKFERSYVSDALAYAAVVYPEMSGEVERIFTKLIKSLPERLPSLQACDAYFAANVISDCIRLEYKHLLPDIKVLYDIDEVDISVCGEYDDVKASFDKLKYHPSIEEIKGNIYELYDDLRK